MRILSIEKDESVDKLLWLLSYPELADLIELVDEQLDDNNAALQSFTGDAELIAQAVAANLVPSSWCSELSHSPHDEFDPAGAGWMLYLMRVEERYMDPTYSGSFSEDKQMMKRLDRLLLDDE